MSSSATDRRGLIIAAAGFAITWWLLRDLAWPARTWAALLIVPLPMLATWQVKVIEDPEALPRMPLYFSSAVSLWFLGLVTVAVVQFSALPWRRLGFTTLPWGAFAGWSAGITVAGLAAMELARRLGIRESYILRRLLPRTKREKVAFCGLSVSAGFCEELVFRGFLMAALALVWNVPVAFILGSVVFGWMHAYQNPAGAARAGALGALLALPVVLTGSILPSMIAHTAIDIVGGIFLQERLAQPVE